ncbi:uncharacterized protein [Littorina saxatilis]|uniref:Caspase recruitment domain-containing protein n=2 Tax=Littorina saxatilis TaxID=31220 RepID=A0AAN9BMI6_9CAEN
MAGRSSPVRTRSEKAALTSKWRWRVQHFLPQLTGNARPFNIIRKMKPPLNIDDPVVREIITLDNEDQCVKATEKLLDYLVSEEGLQPGEIADRWLAFDVALSEAHPLLYDIVHGKIDSMVQEQQKQAVNACMEELSNGLDPRHLYDFLVSKDLLADTEMETLTCKGEHKGPIQSAFYMLSHLHRSANRNWYKDFVKVLGESGYEELVQILNDKYKEIVSNWDTNRVSGASPSRQADPARFFPAKPMPVQQESALCGNFQKQLSLQNTRESSMPQKVQCRDCRGMFNNGARHRCNALAASPAVIQEQGNATASSGARPKDKPTANANLHEKQALGQAAATTRRWDSMTTSQSVNAAELPAAIATPKKQQCPYCKIMFERLGAHKCKAQGHAEPASTEQGHATGGSGVRPAEVPPGSTTAKKQQCPYCKIMFERLGAHKCKAVGQTALASTKQGGATGGSGAQPIKGTDAKEKPKEQCPHCKNKYVNLKNHKKCTAQS